MDDVRGLDRRKVRRKPDGESLALTQSQAVSTFLSTGEMVELERGDIIEHDVGVVLAGTLAVERRLSNGRRALSALFRQDDWIDLRRIERVRQGLLMALTPAKFLVLNDRDIDDLLLRDGFFAWELLGQLREQFGRGRDHATDLVNKTPAERLASVLFEFKRWPENREGTHAADIVLLPITRTDIAHYVGLQPETVSRSLARLESDGLIQVPQVNQVRLIDVPSLRRIANGGRPRKSNRRA
ncbi:MAG: Crp/Fnr family transcriptional regulator [Pseudomonadota bacterium]